MLSVTVGSLAGQSTAGAAAIDGRSGAGFADSSDVECTVALPDCDLTFPIPGESGEYHDDPSVQIFDDGGSWFVTGFPWELAPPVPEQSNVWNLLERVDDAVMPMGPSADDVGEPWAVEDPPVDMCDFPPATPMSLAPVASTAGSADAASAYGRGGDLAMAAAWLNSHPGPEPEVSQLPGAKRRGR